jgi:hypothetical protein
MMYTPRLTKMETARREQRSEQLDADRNLHGNTNLDMRATWQRRRNDSKVCAVGARVVA